MSSEPSTGLEFETGHILFIDIIGYSSLRTIEQHESIHQLSEVVQNAETFRTAEATETVLRLSTGSGIALAFGTTPDAPLRCAMQISKQLPSYPDLKIRMGIHSGPVNQVPDLHERVMVTGAGMSIARRVIDCGDTGHILLSKTAANHLTQRWQWQTHFHELGECAAVPGETVSVVNFYNGDVGNPALPRKFKQGSATGTVRLTPVPAQNNLLTVLFFFAVAAAIAYWMLFPPDTARSVSNPAGPEVQILTATNRNTNPETDGKHRTSPRHASAPTHP